MSSEGNTLSWIGTSRFGALRTFDYLADTGVVHVRCEDVLTLSYSLGPRGNQDATPPPAHELESIDPDGGPYLKVGGLLYHGNTVFRIRRIASYVYNNKQEVLEVVLHVHIVRDEKEEKEK